ncbi:protein-lysine N-methyltransferase EEF2KMT-like isoform X2 [Zingiber officinale]|uniref:protein-lysine N-methyltransferase EEF2KMT-like isoform X2 n=1 Tax=Zingiber officinale TaxID=94328 RepID=UPI001C4AAFD5|nr:protein-lysine N-methyltransferase EEF2KMT-like isoform X2 [Zingiber officinale]
MDSATEACSKPSSFVYLKAAFIAMEPVDCLISLARQVGGGSITTRVQTFILEECINDNAIKGPKLNHKYIKNVLQKLIVAVESTSEVVEGLYEKFAYYLTINLEDQLLKENNRICKQVTFLLSPGNSTAVDLVVSLQCSLNMLEGDTGCALWPSSLFLSEFILSFQEIFSNRFCFEIGSGVGLVGITLLHAGASKVECRHLPWESVSKSELLIYQPEIVLGADIIYDPLCIPHLIRVLSTLLNSVASEPKANQVGCYRFSQESEDAQHGLSTSEPPIAYIATVIRNQETFDCFLRVATENSLSVVDVTEMVKPLNLLPYMQSYDRSSVHLLRVSPICL